MTELLDILTKSNMPHIILAVGKEKLVNFSAISNYIIKMRGSTHSNIVKTRLDELADFNLLEKIPIEGTSREEYTYHATSLLEKIGEKLSYVFDEEKEVLQLPRSIKEDLNHLIAIKKTNKTFEEFCVDAIKQAIRDVQEALF